MAKLITEETIQATLKLIADDIKNKSDAEHIHGYEDLEDLTTESDIDAIWGVESDDSGNVGESGGTSSHEHSNLSTLNKITETKINEWNNKSNFSGNYNDLTNKPTIPDVSNLATKDELFDGDYNSLTNKPTIPDTSNLASKSELFSKNYNDLTNKPTIPTNLTDTVLTLGNYRIVFDSVNNVLKFEVV